MMLSKFSHNLLVLSFFFVLAQHSTGQNADPLSNEALIELRASGQCDEALRRSQTALTTRKTDTQLLLIRAKCNLDVRSFDAALVDIRKSVAIETGGKDNFQIQALGLLNSVERKRSTEFANELIEQKRFESFAFNLRSSNRARERDFDGALDDFVTSLEIEPLVGRWPLNWYGLQAALENFKAFRTNPDPFKKAFDRIQVIVQRLMRQNEAEEKLGGTIARSMAIQQRYFGMQMEIIETIAEVCDKKGRIQCREDAIKKMVEIEPLSQAYRSRINFFRSKARNAEMEQDQRTLIQVLIDEITRDLRNSPNQGQLLYLRSTHHYSLGNLDSARHDFQEAVRIDPERAVKFEELRAKLFENRDKEER